MIRQRYLRFVIVLLGVVLLLGGASSLGADACWFQEVGFLSVLLLRLQTQTAIWVAVTTVSAIYLLGNLAIAHRLQHPTSMQGLEGLASVPARRQGRLRSAATTALSSPLRLRSLFPLSLGCSLLIGFLLLRYGQLAITYWQPDSSLTGAAVPTVTLKTLWQFGTPLSSHLWSLGGILVAAIALLIYPQFLVALTVGLSVLFGFVLSEQWATVLQALHPTSFKSTEPLFGQDIAFYIFSLPLWELVFLWLSGLFFYGLAAVALAYLLSGDSLSQGRFPGFSPEQQRHLYGVGSSLMVAVALGYWLSRYELLYFARGVTFGASYTDVLVQLPANTVLSLVALAIAGYLLWRTIFWRTIFWRTTFWHTKLPHRRWIKVLLTAYGVLAIVGIVAPAVVQYLVVQPNELGRERPYIERTIALTRQAFALEAIDAKTFDPRGQLTAADLQANALTIRNIRLWDQRPLLATNRQLQQIRPYYKFLDADIDRYTLQPEAPAQKRTLPPTSSQSGILSQGGTNEQQQVLISARELDYSGVPQEAQTWVNQHLIYTHGYGFTLSPVNTVGAGGLPEYFVKDIGVTEGSTLSTSSAAIRASIPIGLPRIYYGEVADTYVMTKTNVQELDYPSGRDNVYNTYNGRGGIPIGSVWQRGLFALYLKDWRMVVTRAFQPDTRLLFRRNIKQRLRTIAPFLHYDSDPYLVAANTEPGRDGDQSYLYWIVDAYTTSDRYPYSDPGSEGINYIRNSVKAVVDAYHGSVSFYIVDPADPIITTWSAIFPTLFKPLSAMPASLRQHIRYPVDFFRLQSERLMTYHMTDPQVFYNREDQWQIPNEVYGNEARPVEPYYLITSLPTVQSEEFILLLPYTPRQRTNLIAWLAARSDGKNYGKLRLYTFPKERLVYGTEQIEARINQDPVISQQISLWNRQGSKAIQGNLLVIPIEQSLLYVEPLYLEAAQNSLPTLVRVIVAYENRIVMAPTLDEGLQAIFSPKVTPAPTIIRPIEAPALSP